MPLPLGPLLAGLGQGLLQASASSNLRALKKHPMLVESFAAELSAAEDQEWRRLTKPEKLVWMLRVGRMIDLMADGLDPAMRAVDVAKKTVDSLRGK